MCDLTARKRKGERRNKLLANNDFANATDISATANSTLTAVAVNKLSLCKNCIVNGNAIHCAAHALLCCVNCISCAVAAILSESKSTEIELWFDSLCSPDGMQIIRSLLTTKRNDKSHYWNRFFLRFWLDHFWVGNEMSPLNINWWTVFFFVCQVC